MDNELKSKFIKKYNETLESLKKAISQDDYFGKCVHFGEALGVRSCYAMTFATEDDTYINMCKSLDDIMRVNKTN